MSKRSKLIKPWRVVSEINGGGGQGDLYVVRHETGNPPGEYVLKWLRNPGRQVRFEKELKSLQSVSGHPHIVALADPGALLGADGRFYVMEKAEGSLESLAPPGGYGPQRALALFREILLGVQALHAAGVIHRDLKPANVLLVNGIAKVADTGLCLIVGEDRATPSGEAVGPRYYMAPELEHGRNLAVDFRADLYSLGKVLYWLLSGGVNLPREAWDVGERRIWQTRAPGYVAFKPIFDRTLTQSPSSRFASIGALLSAFDSAVVTYAAHPDTRMMSTLASHPVFSVAFAQMSDDERSAVYNRLKLELLSVAIDELLEVASTDAAWRTEDLLVALDKILDPGDPRVVKLALLYAETPEGLETLFPVFGRKDLSRAMIAAIIEHGTETDLLALASEIASPFSPVDDLISGLLDRLPPEVPLPDKLIGSMATTPRFQGHPSLVEVMRRAADDPEVETQTLVLVAHALSALTSPGATTVLDRVIALAKARPDALLQISTAFVGSEAGLSRLRILMTDSDLPADQRRLLTTLVDAADRSR